MRVNLCGCGKSQTHICRSSEEDESLYVPLGSAPTLPPACPPTINEPPLPPTAINLPDPGMSLLWEEDEDVLKSSQAVVVEGFFY